MDRDTCYILICTLVLSSFITSYKYSLLLLILAKYYAVLIWNYLRAVNGFIYSHRLVIMLVCQNICGYMWPKILKQERYFDIFHRRSSS